MSKREKLARAVYEAQGRTSKWEDSLEWAQHNAYRVVDANIAELREPDGKMIAAGIKANSDVTAIFQAMLDAIE